MTLVHRVLFPHPIEGLEEYLERRGAAGLETARPLSPQAIVAEVEASGLRGRGGAGFPTGRKWRTVIENRSPVEPPTVVVNGAEGEPGTFKDRTILRSDPYLVVEGALIAARAVGADTAIFALKRSFRTEVARLRAAVEEFRAADFLGGVQLGVFEGPGEYLYGEETALLEAIDGRHPFPRIAPPYRRGVEEVLETEADVRSALEGSGLSAHVDMAGPTGATGAAPTLVNNVETIANVPRILDRGAEWFRTEGTDQSPGTIVCTVTGCTRRHGVGEVPMGTPLRQVIEAIGGGPRPGRRIKAVLPGVANALVPEGLLDTPASYEGMTAAGSGLGSAGFIVLDDSVDLTAVAAGVSRFLAVESCGQCTPCKLGGLALSDMLARLTRSDPGAGDLLPAIASGLSTVANEARCYLASQHETVVRSVFDRFHAELDAHAARRAPGVGPVLIAEVVDIKDGVAVLDERHRDKQPDWTYNPEYSGKVPAELLDEHRRHQP
ncbi:MAG TPA: NADH-ubiquinone oxidoreductase-F iron-sulfur binding region domain-containing protein [Acidimicrobiales bacterium]|nr:NADH-ubiquinone oxidoreductase-F iron-sulfur binding region domain-containing protein [Acidimicrobiales bacterium]